MKKNYQKEKIRDLIQKKLSAMSNLEVSIESQRLCEHLARFLDDGKFNSLGAFYPLAQEPNILPVLENWLGQGKLLALPRYDTKKAEYEFAWTANLESELMRGQFGVREPLPGCSGLAEGEVLDVILVPGLAFTKSGLRLGKGRGFYDRLLKSMSPSLTVGLGFLCQQVSELPLEAHDFRLSKVMFSEDLN